MIGRIHLHHWKVTGIKGQFPSIGSPGRIQVVIPPSANTDLDRIQQRDSPLFIPTLYHRSRLQNSILFAQPDISE